MVIIDTTGGGPIVAVSPHKKAAKSETPACFLLAAVFMMSAVCNTGTSAVMNAPGDGGEEGAGVSPEPLEVIGA